MKRFMALSSKSLALAGLPTKAFASHFHTPNRAM